MTICPPRKLPTFKDRDYQITAQNSTFQEWEYGKRSTLGVMPTRCGKTIVFARIIQRMNTRAMVLVHRKDLAWQAKDKIQRVTGLHCDVEMGDYRASMDEDLFNPNAQVIISTVQTQTAGGDGSGRMLKFNPDDFGLLICDEAHHFVSPSFRRNIDHYCKNSKLKVLGVTATPDRADEEALGQVFDSVAFDFEILDMIKWGWLVPVEQQMVHVSGLDLSNVKTQCGDLNQADLDAVMTAEKNLQGVASSDIDIIGDRQGIGFASSVNHARMLANIFNRHRTGMAAWVSARTPEIERKQIISDFNKGNIQFIWNCGIYTEGFDNHHISVVSIARPTKSRALYAQMGGRPMTPHESISHRLNDMGDAMRRRWLIQTSRKPSCLIIDHVGVSGRHKLITTADILGGNVSDDVIESTNQIARQTGLPLRIDRSLEEQEEIIKERKKREAEEVAQKKNLVFKANYKVSKVDPFDVLQIKPTQERGWDKGKILTPGSKNLIRNVFGKDPDEIGYVQGMILVKEFYRRKKNGECTFGQAKILKKNGLDIHMKMKDAKKAIDEIAQRQGWKSSANKPVNSISVRALENAKAQVDMDDLDNVPF